jgi:hypothetical protein
MQGGDEQRQEIGRDCRYYTEPQLTLEDAALLSCKLFK